MTDGKGRRRKSPPANKGKRYPSATLSPQEISRLFDAISGDSTLALRSRALLAVLYSGALRVSEATALRPYDVDLVTGQLHVREGKGERPRHVGLDNGALRHLKVWIERRRSLKLDDRSAYLFCSISGKAKGNRLATSHVRRWLPKLAGAAGIEKRVHAHMLRHTRAAELAAGGVEMHIIRDALGHSSLATTDAYLRDVAPHRVIAEMRASGRTPKR